MILRFLEDVEQAWRNIAAWLHPKPWPIGSRQWWRRAA